MTAVAELLGDQGAALARLRFELATTPPDPAPPAVAIPAVCPECGQLRPVAAVVFSGATPDSASGDQNQE